MVVTIHWDRTRVRIPYNIKGVQKVEIKDGGVYMFFMKDHSIQTYRINEVEQLRAVREEDDDESVSFLGSDLEEEQHA